MLFRQFAFFADEFSREQGNDHAHGQQEDEQLAEHGAVHVHGEAGSGHAADKGGNEACGRDAQHHEMIAGEGPQRGEGAESACELSGAEGGVRRQAAQKHGRGGNESAASGHGIHKTGDKEEQAQNNDDEQGKFHDESLIDVAETCPCSRKRGVCRKWTFLCRHERIRQEKGESYLGEASARG